MISLADPLAATSGGSYVPAEPLIKETLDKFREAPLIGVEYIVEILRPRSEPSYKCMICKNTFDAAGIIADLVSTTHRLKYLVRKLFVKKVKTFLYLCCGVYDQLETFNWINRTLFYNTELIYLQSACQGNHIVAQPRDLVKLRNHKRLLFTKLWWGHYDIKNLWYCCV